MGTHPIFESDFDCLTDPIMSADLQWAIIRRSSCFDLKRAGRTWTKEPGHLSGRKSLRYSTLCTPGGVSVSANPEGGVILKTVSKKDVNKPSKNILSVVIKKNARSTFKSIKNTVNNSNLSKKQRRAAVRKASAILKAKRRPNRWRTSKHDGYDVETWKIQKQK